MKGDCQEVRDIYGILARFAIFRRPGGWLVDVVPGLESFPLFTMFSNWRQEADDIFQKDSAIIYLVFPTDEERGSKWDSAS